MNIRRTVISLVLLATCAIVAAGLMIRARMRTLENQSGFRWDLALTSGCHRINAEDAGKKLAGNLHANFKIALPEGCRIVNAGGYGPDYQYWFEVQLPEGSGDNFKQAIIASAQSQNRWRIIDADANIGNGCGTNLKPLWWNPRESSSRDFFGISYNGTTSPFGPWATYFNLLQPGDRVFIWMQLSD